ncbi:MAG: 6-phosphogluconolactonase [Myxococcaceae bacterium]
MTELFVEQSLEVLAGALAHRFEAAAGEAISARGVFHCALTGGSAARALYPRLVRAKVDWAKTHFHFSDERCVPPDDAESNFRLAQEVLLGPCGVPSAHVHRMAGERPPAEAAREYEAGLPTLDVVHLGVGPDGHVASLFPGHALLHEERARVAALTDSPKPPPARLTLTLAALREARAVWFLVTGEAKRDAVAQALGNPQSVLPAALVHRAARLSLWFLDRAAASRLDAPAS